MELGNICRGLIRLPGNPGNFKEEMVDQRDPRGSAEYVEGLDSAMLVVRPV